MNRFFANLKVSFIALSVAGLLFQSGSLQGALESEIELRYNFGKNIARVPHYGTVALFTEFSLCQSPWVFLSDIRGHYCEGSSWGGNFGLGTRYAFNPNLWLGVNCFFDEFHRKGDLQQFGLGFEILSDCYELRVNAYLPFNHKESVYCSETFRYPEGQFAKLQRYKKSMKGIDMEIGRFFSNCCREHGAYFGTGWYLYQPACGNTIVGARIRAECDWKKIFKFGLIATQDSTFRTSIQGYAAISFSFGKKGCSWEYDDGCCGMYERIYQRPIYREELIVQGKKRCRWKTNY